jgi:hypothetical protein
MSLNDVLGPIGLSALHEGEYVLVLGSGASVGAKSADGKSLPTGTELAADLVRTYHLNVAPNTPLSYVWEAACHKAGSEEVLRRDYLRPKFDECRPAPFHGLIPTFCWKQVFTFNVDDVIMKAYASAERCLQSAIPVHFDDDYRISDPEEVNIVHLHGMVGASTKPITFAPPAYGLMAVRQKTWWHVFADLFATAPLIVVGASLREPDFETYFAQRRRAWTTTTAPGLFITRDVDDATIATCARLGLVAVELAGADFWPELDRLAPGRLPPGIRIAQRMGPVELLSALSHIPHAATLGRQFLFVRQKDTWPQSDRKPEEFFEGGSPTWSDIRENRDTPLRVVGNVIDSIQRSLAAPRTASAVCLHVLEGTAGCGKTTALMRIAATLAAAATDVLYFVDRERFRDDAVLHFAQSLPPARSFVLVVDSIVEHLAQIRRLVRHYPALGGRCAVLGAERSGRASRVLNELGDLLQPIVHPMLPLQESEAADLAANLRRAAKLGRYVATRDEALARIFVGTGPRDWAGQLLVILLEVVPGVRLHDRLRTEWGGLSEIGCQFYGSVCLAAAAGVPIRSAVVFAALRAPRVSEVFEEVFRGEMRGLVRWNDREYILPRHRVIGDETVSRFMTRDQVFSVSLNLALAVAPYVSKDSIRRKAPETRLAGALMDCDGLIVPKLGERAEEWYDELATAFGWNSRYWEQRALLSVKGGRYARARDFSEQAVGLERHPQTWTTCGFVKLVSAERDPGLSHGARAELLESGVEALEEAIYLAVKWDRYEPHAYHILLSRAVRVSGFLHDKVPDFLLAAIGAHAPAAASEYFSRPEMRQALEDLEAAGVWRQS